MALFGRHLSAVRVGEVALRIESVGRVVQRGVVGINPDVLENDSAGGDEVASERVISGSGMREVHSRYGAPAEDLRVSVKIFGSADVAKFTSKKQAFR